MEVRRIEEICNSATHGVGAVAAVAGLVLGIIHLAPPTRLLVGFIIFGSCLVVMLTMSSLYHALTFSKLKGLFRLLDHGAIFLLIAGTYTPFILMLYHGWSRTWLLAAVWCIVSGLIAIEAALPRVAARCSLAAYLILGWLGLALIPKTYPLHGQVMVLLLLGGATYTLGTMLMALKKPFLHAVWHIFVMVAAGLHFIAIIRLA